MKKIGAVGIPIFILFMLLMQRGDITVTGYSGNMTCAGTEEDPCYAYINFTANTDIYIYPNQNWTFSTTPPIKEVILQRSWGDSWRTIYLNKTWNSKVKYAVKFSKGKNYQIRFVGYKFNPHQDIKWSFGDIDPYWYGISNAIKKYGKDWDEVCHPVLKSKYICNNQCLDWDSYENGTIYCSGGYGEVCRWNNITVQECSRTIYSGVMYAQDNNGKWINASDVFYITKNGDDITFHYNGKDEYYNITFEAGVIYNGNYHSFNNVMQSHPEMSISFPTEKHQTYWKYAVNISNISADIQPNIDFITLTYKEHYGFSLNDLKGAKKRFVVKKMGLYFDDLLNKYTVDLDLTNRRILIGNITNNIENGNLYLDPTVKLQEANTENLEDVGTIKQQDIQYGSNSILGLAHDGTDAYRMIYIKFNISSIGGPVTNAMLYLKDNGLEAGVENITIYELDNQTWNEDDIWWNQSNMSSDIGSLISKTTLNATYDKLGTFHGFNVTSWVDSEYDSGKDNVSFVMNATPDFNYGSYWYIDLYSKEYSTTADRPYLNVTYINISNITITDCSVLDIPNGIYYLANNITDSSTSYCMDITANNVTFDCKGFTIDGKGWAGDYGIKISRSSKETANVTIKNCSISDWYRRAIDVYYADNVTIYDVNISDTSGIQVAWCDYFNISDVISDGGDYGILIYYAGYGILKNSTIKGTSSGDTWNSHAGVILEGSNSKYNEISDITLDNNGNGIKLQSYVSNNIIKDCVIKNSNQYGIRVKDTAGYNDPNKIYNNLFNNTANYNGAPNYYNNYSTSYQSGTNIWNSSLGYIWGNAWFKPDGTGFSEYTCNDNNNDGFCDNSYELSSDNIDYHPIAKEIGITEKMPPTYSDNSTNSTLAGTPVEHRLKWNDNVGLSGYIFSFCNGTWNGTSCGFQNIICYQEFANESTDCGGLGTGSYSSTNLDNNNWYDGNDITYSTQSDAFSDTYAYVNYTVPNGAINETRWEVISDEGGAYPLNYTLGDCWNQNILQLRIYISAFGTTFDAQCWNGSSWVSTVPIGEGDEDGAKIYEEKIYWKIVKDNWMNDSWVSMSGTMNWSNVTKVVNSTVGATIAWKVYANDSNDNWNASDVYSFETTYNPHLTDCSNLNVDGGIYYLDNNITDSSTTPCINISANNIIFDCKHHTIDGNDTTEYGIYVYRDSSTNTNITIKNCVVTDWNAGGICLDNANSNIITNITANSNHNGLHILHSDSNSLFNITSNSNSAAGLYLYGSSDYNNLTNITTDYNSYGLYFYSSDSNNLTDITSNSNTYGLYLYSSDFNIIKDSKLQDNSYCGIYLYKGAGSNTIYNNILNNTDSFGFVGTVYANDWNTSYQTGTNIWNDSLGYIWGNAWFKPDGSGYSESDNCKDTNSDGFCDDAYILDIDNTDYHPIAEEISQNPGAPDIEYSINSNTGATRIMFVNCSPDWEYYPSEPQYQTDTHGIINATNNGTATGDFQIEYIGTLADGWKLWSCNASSTDPKTSSNCILLSNSWQTLWNDVAASEEKNVWLYANCSYVSGNPNVDIDMQAVS